MNWEILATIIGVTVFRLVWIVRRPVHRDITSYIFPGLRNLRKIVKYAPDFSYVPYGLIWYGVNVPIVRLGRYNGRFWMGALALIDAVFLGYIFQALGLTVFFSYVLIGTFQLLRAPWNASINWLIMLAPISWIFLLLAPLQSFLSAFQSKFGDILEEPLDISTITSILDCWERSGSSSSTIYTSFLRLRTGL